MPRPSHPSCSTYPSNVSDGLPIWQHSLSSCYSLFLSALLSNAACVLSLLLDTSFQHIRNLNYETKCLHWYFINVSLTCVTWRGVASVQYKDAFSAKSKVADSHQILYDEYFKNRMPWVLDGGVGSAAAVIEKCLVLIVLRNGAILTKEIFVILPSTWCNWCWDTTFSIKYVTPALCHYLLVHVRNNPAVRGFKIHDVKKTTPNK
jgi:hypothetical protein